MRNQAGRTDRQEADGAGSDRTLIFRIGTEYFGIRLTAVAEVLAPTERPAPVPGSPPWMEGLINHHGQIVPVVRMDLFMGIASRAACNHLVMVNLPDGTFGLAVEQIESLEEVRSDGSGTPGRKRCWYRGSLLELLEPDRLMEDLQARLLGESTRS
jgi:chemotaxis signal transduction protein